TAVRTRFPEYCLKTGKELPIFFILPPEVGRRHERKCGNYIRPQLQSLGQTDSYQVCSERRVMGPESNSGGACEESGKRSRILVGVISRFHSLRNRVVGTSATEPFRLKVQIAGREDDGVLVLQQYLVTGYLSCCLCDLRWWMINAYLFVLRCIYSK